MTDPSFPCLLIYGVKVVALRVVGKIQGLIAALTKSAGAKSRSRNR